MYWWRENIHVSWHIAWYALGILLGIAFAALRPPGEFASVAWLIVSGALSIFWLRRRHRVMVFLALGTGLLVGLWRGGTIQQELTDYRPYLGTTVSIYGTISEDPTLDENLSQQIYLSNIRIQENTLPGSIWVRTYSRAEVKRGDQVVVEGILAGGFGSHAGAMYRARLVNTSRPDYGDMGREVRDWFAAHIRQVIPEPQASLGIGFLTGQHATLPEALTAQLQLLGLTHIVVASGYNLTILVRLMRRLFARISAYMAVTSGGIMIAGFMLITGFSPSMSRAGLIAGLSLLAWYYGRTIHPFVLLPFAGAVTAVIHPFFIWGDLGWYLSFAAFAGVIILAPLVHHFFWGKKDAGIIRRLFVETSCAQIVTLPLTALTFGQFAPLAIPANMLILPLLPFAMLGTFIAGLGNIASLPWIGLPATFILGYMTNTVGWFASLPMAHGEIAFDVSSLIISYMLIFCIGVILWRSTRHSFKNDSLVV